MQPTRHHADHAWLPSGFARDVEFAIEASTRGSSALQSVHADAPRAATSSLGRIVVPGMPNLHSHAFQRAMAGLAERRAPQQAEDSFWSWREVMYAFAGRIGPDDLR